MAETITDDKWDQLPEDLKQQAGYEGISIDPLSLRSAHCTGSTATGNKFTLTWRPEWFMMISLFEDEQALIEAFAVVVEYDPFCKYRYRSTGLITYEWAKEDSKERFEELQQADGIDELQLLVDESQLSTTKTEEQNAKKPRQTTYEVRCKGYIIAHINSYFSKELEHNELLHNASRAASKLGYDCSNVLEAQRGVACEMLTVTALDPKRHN